MMKKNLFEFFTDIPLWLLIAFDGILAKIRPRWRGRVRGRAVEALLGRRETIEHESIRLSVLTPNSLCEYRAASFSYKEPETLQWINEFVKPEVIWDIGANIGLYSIYSAKRHGNIKVYAFEPSILNLELLVRNVHINGFQDRIVVMPCPLFSEMNEDVFRLQSADRGGALSAFAVDYGYDNKPLNSNLSYRTIGVSMDDIVGFFKVPQPDHIKMDVDGVEHLILQGGSKVLSDTRLKSILVELNDDFAEQKALAEAILTGAGFGLAAKLRSENQFDASAGQVWNNIWVRN